MIGRVTIYQTWRREVNLSLVNVLAISKVYNFGHLHQNFVNDASTFSMQIRYHWKVYLSRSFNTFYGSQFGHSYGKLCSFFLEIGQLSNILLSNWKGIFYLVILLESSKEIQLFLGLHARIYHLEFIYLNLVRSWKRQKMLKKWISLDGCFSL